MEVSADSGSSLPVTPGFENVLYYSGTSVIQQKPRNLVELFPLDSIFIQRHPSHIHMLPQNIFHISEPFHL